jgi:GxxExxY protein
MGFGETTSAEAERIVKEIVDAAFTVHSRLGPGLLESVYEACMECELKRRGLDVKRQVIVPIIYDDIIIDDGLRIDLLVEDQIIIELKAVEKHHPLFEAQVLTYLKLTNRRLALLINFNVPMIKDGIKRIIR